MLAKERHIKFSHMVFYNSARTHVPVAVAVFVQTGDLKCSSEYLVRFTLQGLFLCLHCEAKNVHES